MILHDYDTSSGRNLIIEYIESLTEKEIIDAYTVREYMENGEFEKFNGNRGIKKYTKYIFINIIAYSILFPMERIYICYMLAENRKIKLKRQMQK